MKRPARCPQQRAPVRYLSSRCRPFALRQALGMVLRSRSCRETAADHVRPHRPVQDTRPNLRLGREAHRPRCPSPPAAEQRPRGRGAQPGRSSPLKRPMTSASDYHRRRRPTRPLRCSRPPQPLAGKEPPGGERPSATMSPDGKVLHQLRLAHANRRPSARSASRLGDDRCVRIQRPDGGPRAGCGRLKNSASRKCEGRDILATAPHAPAAARQAPARPPCPPCRAPRKPPTTAVNASVAPTSLRQRLPDLGCGTAGSLHDATSA